MKTITLLFFIFHFSFFTFHLSEAQVIHVPEDYPSIQLGINAANPGDTVLVSDGIYFEQINFKGKAPLVVASEFLTDGNSSHIISTVIDGSQLTNADSASVVYFISGEDTNSVLCGFTIRNGKGTYNPDNLEIRQGGGIFISDAGAKIIHNRITHNVIDDTQPVNGTGAGGAGIATPWEESDNFVILENNTIDSNTCISDSFQAYGGGIATSYCTRISNNIISYNTCTGLLDANAGGGGIDYERDPLWTTPVFAIIRHNVISHNRSQAMDSNWATSAGAWIGGVQLSFSNNEVTYNQTFTGSIATTGGVGGILLFTAVPGSVISNNLFRGNISNLYTGGLHVENFEILDNTVLVENNYFYNNAAYKGGGYSSLKAPVILQNNVFSGNHADYRGGAVYTSDILFQPIDHLVTLVNNSFFNNSATEGGAICAFNGSHLAFNNIFWQDSALSGQEIYMDNQARIEIAYSNLDVDGTYGQIFYGGGNMIADPLFEDTLSLKPWCYSPCIDQGVSEYTCSHDETYFAPEYDIEGNDRPLGEGVDIGAYDTIACYEGIFPVGSLQLAVRTYPNPTNGIVNLQFTISNLQSISLKIYDVQGREVAVVVDKNMPAGKHTVRWDAGKLPAGIYYYRLTTDDYRLTTGKLVKY